MIVVDSNILAYFYLPGGFAESAYDCEFAALVMTLDVNLVTMDKKLLATFPELSVPLVAI